MNEEIIMLDRDRRPIRESSVFTFKYMEDLHKSVKLTGSFSWCQEELRYEIDIHNHSRYLVLSYVGNGQMYDFKKIK